MITLEYPDKQTLIHLNRTIKSLPGSIYLSKPLTKTDEQIEEQVDKLIKQWVVYTICNDGSPIWYIWLNKLNQLDRNWDIVIAIRTDYTGKWFWTEALRLFIAHCFNVLWLHKLKAHILSINMWSLKLFEKLWFTISWIYRDESWIDNKYVSKYIYELLNTQSS